MTVKINTEMNEPKVGDVYTTQKTGVIGLVMEVVPNRTGSIRLRLLPLTEQGFIANTEFRWTTWVPKVK
jgi:hypothetical protein